MRFSSELISALYLIVTADFIACHQFHFINSNTILDNAVEGATFLLNSTFGPDEIWDHLPRVVAKKIVRPQINFDYFSTIF